MTGNSSKVVKTVEWTRISSLVQTISSFPNTKATKKVIFFDDIQCTNSNPNSFVWILINSHTKIIIWVVKCPVETTYSMIVGSWEMLNSFSRVLKLYTKGFVDFRKLQVLFFLSGYKTIYASKLLKVVIGFLNFRREIIWGLFKRVKIVVKLSFYIIKYSQLYFACFVWLCQIIFNHCLCLVKCFQYIGFNKLLWACG